MVKVLPFLMLKIERRPGLTGDDGRAAFAHCEESPPFLVDDLITEGTTFMLCADGGVGKSTVATCAAAAMSSGLPVFGQFVCPHPLRVYYILGERSTREPLRRLKSMAPRVPLNFDNLWLNDSFASNIDLTKEDHAAELISTIHRECPKPDIVILDPLYPFVAGGLSDDRVASLLCRSLTLLKTTLHCALWLNHHNTKTTMTAAGDETRRANPYYGSVWLFNHVEAQYNLKKDGANHVAMTIQKDTHTVLLPVIPLKFDPDTFVVEMDGNNTPLQKRDRAVLFLRQKQSDQTTFSRAEIEAVTGVSRSEFFRLNGTGCFRGRIVNVSPDGITACYRVTK